MYTKNCKDYTCARGQVPAWVLEWYPVYPTGSGHHWQVNNLALHVSHLMSGGLLASQLHLDINCTRRSGKGCANVLQPQAWSSNSGARHKSRRSGVKPVILLVVGSVALQLFQERRHNKTLMSCRVVPLVLYWVYLPRWCGLHARRGLISTVRSRYLGRSLLL